MGEEVDAEAYDLCLLCWGRTEQRGDVEQPNCDRVRQQDEEKGTPEEGDCKINRMAANKSFDCFLDANKTLRNGSQGTRRVYKVEINRGIYHLLSKSQVSTYLSMVCLALRLKTHFGFCGL